MSLFGDNLKKFREERGMSYEELAKKSQTYEIRLRSYEYGSGLPNNRIILRIANALGVTVKDLVGTIEKPEPKNKKEPAPAKKNVVIIQPSRKGKTAVTEEYLNKIDRSTFGGNLKYYREKAGLSMTQIGALIGVAPTTFSAYENCGKMPSAERIADIAKALGVQVRDLTMNDGSEKQVIDDYDLRDYLEELKDRPEIRTLFSISRNATKEDVDQTVSILNALAGNHDDFE